MFIFNEISIAPFRLDCQCGYFRKLITVVNRFRVEWIARQIYERMHKYLAEFIESSRGIFIHP